MSRQWSCATLGQGAKAVENDFVAHATPEALEAYEQQVRSQIEVPRSQHVQAKAVIFSVIIARRSIFKTNIDVSLNLAWQHPTKALQLTLQMVDEAHPQ